MLAMFSDQPDTLNSLQRAGVEAKVIWHSDIDQDTLIFVPADSENLARLERWFGVRPKSLVPAA